MLLSASRKTVSPTKVIDFLVNNELRKKLTDANKLMIAFGTVAHDIREDFNRAVCEANPRFPILLFWC
jgi:hypothetical protein